MPNHSLTGCTKLEAGDKLCELFEPENFMKHYAVGGSPAPANPALHLTDARGHNPHRLPQRQRPVEGNRHPALRKVDRHATAYCVSDVEFDLQRRVDPQADLPPRVQVGFVDHRTNIDRISDKAKPGVSVTLPYRFKREAFAIAQLEFEPLGIRKGVKQPGLDPAGRCIAQNAKELSRARHKLASAQQELKARRGALIDNGLFDRRW